MSYILEALKKIEQKQQRQGTPRLLSIPLDIPEEEKKSRTLLYVIVGALVLNAAVITAWWVAPWRRPEPVAPVAESLSMPQKEASGIATMAPATASHSPVVVDPTEKQTASVALEKSTPVFRPEVPEGAEATSGQRAKVSPPPAGQPPDARSRKETKSAFAASSTTLLDLGDLPPPVKGSLPEFKISGHAYSSEPRFRVARVNNKIVQEGETLSQGLKVDEIVPGGVIFTYRGYRFRVGINDNP